MNFFWQAVSEDTWKLTLGHSLPNIATPKEVRRHFTVAALWAKQEIWISTSSFTVEKNPQTAQNVGSQVLNPLVSILETQCTMGLSIALRISKITKSKGPDFAQFWSKPSEAVGDRWKTAQISRGKYFHKMFLKNVVLIVEKHEGHDC